MYYLIPNIQYILCIKYYIIYAFLTSPPAAVPGSWWGPLGPLRGPLLGQSWGLLLGLLLGPLGALPCRLNTRQYKGKKTH